jgi:spore coat protein U-like protein
MKSKFLAAGLAVALMSPAVGMAASTTHTLNVSASVNGVCRFDVAGPTALAFGAIDPTSASAATATANVTFKCTNGTTSAITKAGANDSGGHRLKNGTNFLPYTAAMTGDAQAGTGFAVGQEKTVTIDGSIAPADFQNAPAGAYTDTLTLTITP